MELLVALAVAATLAGLAVPTARSMMRESRLTTTANDLLFAIYLARSEAIKRGRRVTLCTSGNADECRRGVGWRAGWLVFEDANGNGMLDSGEALVRVFDAAEADGRLSMVGNAPVRDYVSYTPTGQARTVGGAPQMGAITVCDAGAGRKIVINSAGRPRVERLVSC